MKGRTLIFITFEFLIFREINTIHQKITKIKKKDFSSAQLDLSSSDSTNPLRRVNHEIMLYASQKQREIEELKRMENFRRELERSTGIQT